MTSEMRSRPPTSRTRFFSRVAMFDLAWAAVSPALAFVARDGGFNRPDSVALYCSIAVLASLLSFQWFRISVPISGFFSLHDASKIVRSCVATVAVTVVVLFSFTRLEDAPRSVPLIHLLLLAAGLLFQRSWYRIVRQGNRSHLPIWSHHTENVLIIDASRLAWFFSKMVEEFAPRDICIVAILDKRPELRHRSLNGHAIVGAPSHLSTIVEEYANHGIDIHKVVLAMHPDDLEPTVWEEIKRTCDVKGIRTEWLYDRFLMTPSHVQAPLSPRETDGAGMEPVTGGYWAVKRILDIILALITLVVAAPLSIVVAILVIIDVGMPIVFWQQRIGQFGSPLHVYKFRTMRVSIDQEGRSVPDKARLSTLGYLLRRNRLDEIPQLFNILRGDMSFVGPRPLLPIDQPKSANARLQVKPGLTGLAQVNGGKLLSPEEKDALDEWYVRNASLWLDLSILIRTVWVILTGDRRNDAKLSKILLERRTHAQATDDASTASRSERQRESA